MYELAQRTRGKGRLEKGMECVFSYFYLYFIFVLGFSIAQVRDPYISIYGGLPSLAY